MRIAVASLCLLALGAAAAPAFAADDVRARLLEQHRYRGGIVVRKERVAVGPRTSIVTSVTMPRPGRGRALEPYLPNDMVSEGTATTSSVSRALDRYGTAVAINADLFEYASGQPSGLLLIDGELYNQPQGGRPALAVDVDGTLSASRPKSIGTLTLPGGRKVPFENNVKRDDGVVAYDGGWGPTAPPGAGHSFLGRILDGDLWLRHGAWIATADLRAVRTRAGDLPIPPDESPDMHFGAYGKAASALARLKRGAKVSIRYRLAPLPAKARFAIGGGPILIRDGRIVYRRSANKEFSDGQLMPPDARTAVAQLRDGRIVFYAVSDTNGSDGFTVGEVARDLHHRGARTAMAFDSGGSTAISLDGRLLNAPKDGYERPVGNMLVYFRPDKRYRKPIGAVDVGKLAVGARVPPLSFSMRRRVKASVTLTDPKGRVFILHDGPVRAGTSHVRLPKRMRMRSGRWELEVAVPDYQDRVVKAFTVAAHPKAGPAEEAETGAADPGEADRAGPAAARPDSSDDGGAGALPWIAGGVVVVAVGAGAAALALARRRRTR